MCDEDQIQGTVEIKEELESKSVDCHVTDEDVAVSIYGYNVDDATTILIHFLKTMQTNNTQKKKKSYTVGNAIETLKNKMQYDPEYAQSWHDNIAVCAADAGASYNEANEGASRFMKLCFDVNTDNEETMFF